MAISDRPDWHDNDEEILAFQEDYPDVYEFVLKVLDGNFDDPILQAFEDDYGEAYLEGFLKIISGKASEKDIQEFREEFGDDIYNAIVKMIRKRNPVIEGAPEEELDEAGWEKLKPQFIKIYQETERAGNSAKTFVQLVLKAFGVKVKPYLSHFMREVRDGKIDVRAEHKIEPIKSPLRREKFRKGDFIGQKYEVFDVLGEGGFGIVYLVYSHETKSAYALKTFRDKYLEDIMTRERFRKEAQVWIDLERHSYLVRAYYVDEISGRFYIAMEHIASDEPGMNTLEGYLRSKPPDLAQSLKWAIQFCHGMEYAYSKGVKAHRDIKPANIMIDQNKSVKITDFGLAGILPTSSVAEQDSVAGKPGNAASMQTAIGTSSIGTPEYMSPEQFTDFSACDERSDIYSFGIVLYQMASGGSLPFSSDNPDYQWAALKHFHQETPVPKLNTPLFPVILRCLEKEPKKRYLTFKEVRGHLEPILQKLSGEIIEKPDKEKLDAGEWNNKGVSLDKIGKTTEALECYEKALKMNPMNANALCNKGLAFVKLNELSKAINCFDSALKINKNHVLALSNKAIALEFMGQLENALDCYKKAVQLSPDLCISWINLSACQFKTGNYEEALQAADKALEISNDYASAWNNKGLILYNLDRDEDAFMCFNKAVKIDPFCTPAWENIGMMLHDSGKYDKAIDCYNHILATIPNHEKAWVKKGDCLVTLKNFDDALKCYGKAITNNNLSLDAWIGSSIAFWLLKEDQHTYECYDRALLLDPDHVYTWYRQGELFLSSNYFEAALECYDKAINKNPGYAKAWLGKYKALDGLGRDYEASEAYKKYGELRSREKI
jgi:tetratricopeptide (TPR) repeat protein/tRNA A-37 threonylcarbamoyl transferase component Bud32